MKLFCQRLIRFSLFLLFMSVSLEMVFAFDGRDFDGRERYLSESEAGRLNDNRIGIITGSPGGTYIRLARDLGNLLDDFDKL